MQTWSAHCKAYNLQKNVLLKYDMKDSKSAQLSECPIYTVFIDREKSSHLEIIYFIQTHDITDNLGDFFFFVIVPFELVVIIPFEEFPQNKGVPQGSTLTRHLIFTGHCVLSCWCIHIVNYILVTMQLDSTCVA